MRIDPFIPYASQNIATSIASSATALGSGSVVRLVNTSSTAGDVVYAALGNAAGVVTVGGGIAIMPGATAWMSRAEDPVAAPAGIIGGVTHVLLIAAANTPAVNVTTGEGGAASGA